MSAHLLRAGQKAKCLGFIAAAEFIAGLGFSDSDLTHQKCKTEF